LAEGVEVTLSDAILVFRHEAAPDERESARRFLQMLGVAYKMLDLPITEYRDWVERSERTLRDLAKAPAATISHYGNLYMHPYTDAEYPDIDGAGVAARIDPRLRQVARQAGSARSQSGARAGSLLSIPRSSSMRRYLPNVGKDKDKDAVDSWYLYHPLLRAGESGAGWRQARTTPVR
jgi:hypothetical protein